MAQQIKTKIGPKIDLTMRNTFTTVRICQPNSFGDTCKKNLSDPYVLLLVTAAMFFAIKNPHISFMQNTPKNIHTNFGSHRSSSVRGE